MEQIHRFFCCMQGNRMGYFVAQDRLQFGNKNRCIIFGKFCF